MGLMQSAGARTGRLERQERGRKESLGWGRSRGGQRMQPQQRFGAEPPIPTIKYPTQCFFFGWVSRYVFRMSPCCPPPPSWGFLRGLSAGSSRGGQGRARPSDPGLPDLPQPLSPISYSSSHSYYRFRCLFLFKEELEVFT